MDLIDTHLNREKNDKILIDNSLPMTDGKSKFRVENELFDPIYFLDCNKTSQFKKGQNSKTAKNLSVQVYIKLEDFQKFLKHKIYS